MAHGLRYFISLRITASHCHPDLPEWLVPRLHRAIHSRLPLSLRVPTVLSYRSTGISTCCPSATTLVLALGAPDLPRWADQLTWKPWIFGLKDSHLYLATHSGILSSMQSTAPYGTASFRMQCSSTDPCGSLSFGGTFQPRTFSAQGLSTSELLRTPLNEWLLLSQHPGCLRDPTSFPIATTLGPLTEGLGLFPFLTAQLISCSLTPVLSTWHSSLIFSVGFDAP